MFEEKNALAVVSAYVEGMRKIVPELKTIGAIFQRRTDSGVPQFYTDEFESWFVQRETELLQLCQIALNHLEVLLRKKSGRASKPDYPIIKDDQSP